MKRQPSAARREDEGRMVLFVLIVALSLLALCAASWALAETPAAQMFVVGIR